MKAGFTKSLKALYKLLFFVARDSIKDVNHLFLDFTCFKMFCMETHPHVLQGVERFEILGSTYFENYLNFHDTLYEQYGDREYLVDFDERDKIATSIIFFKVIEYIKQVVLEVKPKNGLWIAFEGKKPFARMYEKRVTELRNALKKTIESKLEESFEVLNIDQATPEMSNEEFTLKALEGGRKIFKNLKVDTTNFRKFFNQYLKDTLKDHLLESMNHETWINFQVNVLGELNEFGEGEMKIAQKIKDIDDPSRIVIYGGDSDLILIGLSLLQHNIFIMKEPYPEDNSRDRFKYMSIIKLSNLLFDTINGRQLRLNLNRVMDDLIVFFSLLGNDFFANIPTFHCGKKIAGKSCLEYLLDCYYLVSSRENARNKSREKIYLVKRNAIWNEINLSFLRSIFYQLKIKEGNIWFNDKRSTERNYTPQRNLPCEVNDTLFNKIMDNPCFHIYQNESTINQSWQAIINQCSPIFTGKLMTLKDTVHTPEGFLKISSESRKNYYVTSFWSKFQDVATEPTFGRIVPQGSNLPQNWVQVNINNGELFEDRVDEICKDYLLAIKYLMDYYLSFSWNNAFYYPHAAAPLASDLFNFLNVYDFPLNSTHLNEDYPIQGNEMTYLATKLLTTNTLSFDNFEEPVKNLLRSKVETDPRYREYFSNIEDVKWNHYDKYYYKEVDPVVGDLNVPLIQEFMNELIENNPGYEFNDNEPHFF